MDSLRQAPPHNLPELHGHVPGLLQELRQALVAGRAPTSSATAADHGERGQEFGFDVEAVVREYQLLLNAILDSAEAQGVALTMSEVRIVTEFVSRAVAQGVAAHRRYALSVQEKVGQASARQQERAAAAQRRLEGVFQNAPAFMAALHGPSHVFTLVNQHYQRLVGAGRPLLGLKVAEALPEVVPQGFIELLDSVYRSGVAYVGSETRLSLERGGTGPEEAYLNFVYQPTRDGNDAIDGIDVFGFDVTEQVLARQRVETLVKDVRAREAELRLVVDAVPLLVSFVSAEERYGLVNHAYEEWFGIERDSLRGRTVADVVGEKAYAQLGPFVKRALAGDSFTIEQYDVAYSRGGTRDIAVTFVSRYDSTSRVVGYVVVIADITSRRRLEAERERLLVSERGARREADLQREQLQALVATAPIGIATWRGPQHVFASANGPYLSAFQKDAAIVGQTLASAFPELPSGHSLFAIYDDVYRTGTPFVDPEYRITLMLGGRPQAKIYVFHLTPIRDVMSRVDGVMACILDVTDVVGFRELVEVERDLATAVASLEARSRQASDDARTRTEFLLRVAGSLSESLELRVVLQRLVETIAPDHARLASVWTALPGGPPRRIVHAPFRPELSDAEASPMLRTEATRLAMKQVLDTAKPLRIDDYSAWLQARGAGPEVAGAVTGLGVGPVLLLPIRRDQEAVAVLGLARASGHSFSPEDSAVFESVARLAALAFENARLYGEMVRLRKEAEDATVAKDRFLAHVSHDLRNPLTSILGWSTLLRGMRNDPVQFMRGLDVIERNAKSQVQLVEDLLDVSRIASGQLALEIAVEDVQAAVDTALDAARLAASSKKIELIVAVDNDIGTIAVDSDRFRQIIWNLVSNAVKFTPSGGTVTVSAQRLASTLQLAVSDTGRGITPEFLPRVFSAFEQAERGAGRSSGLGLGLAIVRRLVELHGGTIRAESAGENRGSCFTVELPIRAAAPSLRAPPTTNPRALSGVRVLIVDDEEEAREVVKVILEQAGASVTTAASSDEALEVLLQGAPHIVVSDVGMPGKDGKAFVREVRSLPEERGGRVPAVALTALVRTKDRVEILAAGFNAHVAKPVEPAELVFVVIGLLGRQLPENSGAAPS